MELSKNYDHRVLEQKWYAHWMEKGYFNSTPDERPSYTIVIPPPNVTGVLHMGHALNNTVQDILLRRAKMLGYNTCWVPGTDHASIATEAKVVHMLKEKGIDKNTLSREEFLNYAWQWKEEYGGIILEQLKRLGCSLDWNRTHFTMDSSYYKTVIKVFVDLYQKGYIYRGAKMINWDPQAKTALSDEEVIFKDTNSKLTYIRYKIDDDSDQYITIATVRPETILGDTAICVHPDDERFKHLKGKYALVPLINRRIPIIFDDYIDMEFGTGALKVTPAHDVNDYNLGLKHHLPVIDTLNEDGTLSEAATLYVGLDRFYVREKIVDDLKASGNFVKQEDYKNQVGYSERTNVAIEPRISMQWWCNMDELAQPALDAVMEEDIRFFPGKYKNLYKHWMTNIKDWCISRQLWWGQRIPAWYDENGEIFVAENEEEAIKKWAAKNNKTISEEGLKNSPLLQDSDVLDTWFSSWLWPLEVFDWGEHSDHEELNYYYPTKTLVTGPDIIFFWVARMIMAGFEYKKTKPFEQVYFTGIVRDKSGRKMSKQLGNSPDLLKMIDDHGADMVRFSVLISSPAGNDILFDEAFLEQGRNFTNKIWNALKLVKLWESRMDEQVEVNNLFAVEWMEARLNEARIQIDHLYEDFKLNEALKTIYSLIWDDFCSWYLEWVKPGYGSSINKQVYINTIELFEKLMQLLHPFMPFITEEVYHLLRDQDNDLMQLQLAPPSHKKEEVLGKGILLQQLISSIRDTRNKYLLKPKETVSLYIQTQQASFYEDIREILQKQVNADKVELVDTPPEGTVALVVQNEKLYLYCNTELDTSAQKEKLEDELKYLEGFLQSVERKLSNERFVTNAKPEIVENERKKLSDAQSKIQTLKESLSILEN